jgi:hypothetical protein
MNDILLRNLSKSPPLSDDPVQFGLQAHPIAADGIADNARHDDRAQCYALFETAQPSIREVERQTDLDANWYWELAEIYGLGHPPAS